MRQWKYISQATVNMDGREQLRDFLSEADNLTLTIYRAPHEVDDALLMTEKVSHA